MAQVSDAPPMKSAPFLEPAIVVRVDGELEGFREALGPDAAAYRNHVCRVLAFTARLLPPGRPIPEPLVFAGIFHDLASGPTAPLTTSDRRGVSRRPRWRGPEGLASLSRWRR